METSFTEERLDTLLALAIAFSERENSENIAESSRKLLLSLPVADVNKLHTKLAIYENLAVNERKAWKSRVLSRMQGASPWLDKSIHHSHICEVLRLEPLHLQCFILSRLPSDIADPIAIALGIFQHFREFIDKNAKSKKPSQSKTFASKFSQKDPTFLVRQTFLTNFVSFEDIYLPKSLDYLTGDDLIQAIYLMGIGEISLACCGIKEIESLATFLRQFSAYNSQLIVSSLAKHSHIEKNRIKQAENLIQHWWEQSENDTSALIGFIGIHKLARAFSQIEEIQFIYAKQKLSLQMTQKIDSVHREVIEKLVENDAEELELVETAGIEFESITSQMLREKIEGRKHIDVGFDAPEFIEEQA
jgi:hypothetical protein